MISFEKFYETATKCLIALALAFAIPGTSHGQFDNTGSPRHKEWKESKIRPGYLECEWALVAEVRKDNHSVFNDENPNIELVYDTVAMLRLFYDKTIDKSKKINNRYTAKALEIMPQNGNASREDLATCSWYIHPELYAKGARFKTLDVNNMKCGFSSPRISDFRWIDLCETKNGIRIPVDNPYRHSVEMWLSIEIPSNSEWDGGTDYNPWNLNYGFSRSINNDNYYVSVTVPYDNDAPAYSTSEAGASRYDSNVPNIYYTNFPYLYDRKWDLGFPKFERGMMSKSYYTWDTGMQPLTYLLNPVWEEFITDELPQKNIYVQNALNWNGERTSNKVVEAVWNPQRKRYELNLDMGIDIHYETNAGMGYTVQAIVRGEEGHAIGMGHRFYLPYYYGKNKEPYEYKNDSIIGGAWKVFRDFVTFRAVGMNDDSKGTVDRYGNVEFLNRHPNGGWIKAEYSPDLARPNKQYPTYRDYISLLIGDDKKDTLEWLTEDFPVWNEPNGMPGEQHKSPSYHYFRNPRANLLVLFSDRPFQVSDVNMFYNDYLEDGYYTSARESLGYRDSTDLYNNVTWGGFDKARARAPKGTAAPQNTARQGKNKIRRYDLFHNEFSNTATDCLINRAISFPDRGKNLNRLVYVNRNSALAIEGRTRPYNIVVEDVQEENVSGGYEYTEPKNAVCDSLYLTDRGVYNGYYDSYYSTLSIEYKDSLSLKSHTSYYPVFDCTGTFQEYTAPNGGIPQNSHSYRASGYDFGAPYEFKAKSVRFDRNFTAGRKATIYMPFDMTTEDLQKLNVEEALKFDSIRGIYAVFSHANATPGNTGYLITPVRDVVTHEHGQRAPKVTPVDFGEKDILASPVIENRPYDYDYWRRDPALDGTYVFRHIDPNSTKQNDSDSRHYYFFNWSTGLFNKPNSQHGTNFKAFRAAISLPYSVWSKNAFPNLTLSIDDGQTSGIGGAAGDDAATAGKKPVYTIDGRCVSTDGNTEGLPSGVYIVNGKKIVL